MQQKKISSKTRLVALLGSPARHSLSPVIQNRFMAGNGIDAVYVTFEFPEQRLKDSFEGARSLGIYGLNITMPFKEGVFNLVDKKDESSRVTRSVNTVIFEEKGDAIESTGYNTDIDGFIFSLKKKRYNIENRNCLVLGAGGAARSAVFAFLKSGASSIYIFNRTKENAELVKNAFEDDGRIIVLDYLYGETLKEYGVDLICNCTPIGMGAGKLKGMIPVPDDWDFKDKIVFETIYDPLDTGLIIKAKKEGARIIDGLDMLINQAASSFYIWFAIKPDTGKIRPLLLKDCIQNES